MHELRIVKAMFDCDSHLDYKSISKRQKKGRERYGGVFSSNETGVFSCCCGDSKLDSFCVW